MNPARGQPVNLWRNVSVSCALRALVKNARNRRSSHGVTSPATRSRNGDASNGDTSRDEHAIRLGRRVADPRFLGHRGRQAPVQRAVPPPGSHRQIESILEVRDEADRRRAGRAPPRRAWTRIARCRERRRIAMRSPASGVATLAQLAGLHFLDGGDHLRRQSLLPRVVPVPELNALDVAAPRRDRRQVPRTRRRARWFAPARR